MASLLVAVGSDASLRRSAVDWSIRRMNLRWK